MGHSLLKALGIHEVAIGFQIIGMDDVIARKLVNAAIAFRRIARRIFANHVVDVFIGIVLDVDFRHLIARRLIKIIQKRNATRELRQQFKQIVAHQEESFHRLYMHVCRKE